MSVAEWDFMIPSVLIQTRFTAVQRQHLCFFCEIHKTHILAGDMANTIPADGKYIVILCMV